jgi:hypothetical protein
MDQPCVSLSNQKPVLCADSPHEQNYCATKAVTHGSSDHATGFVQHP